VNPRSVPFAERIQAYRAAHARNVDFAVANPATGELLAEVPDLGRAETLQAIGAAERAFPAWSARTAKDRCAILRRWHDAILANQGELAQLLTLEQGKPLAEARAEILYGASFVEWFAEEARRAYGDVIPTHAKDKRLLVLKQPVGVVGAITPWNFPNAMVTRKAAPALAAGCTIVLKPAEETPLSAIALQSLALEAGIPPGVMNTITSNRPAEVGAALTGSETVRKLSFTGSTEVGRLLMRQCGATLKKLSLELGGNAPFIVFDDADMDAAVSGAVAAKFRNAGQTCVSANRILVQAGIHDEFVQRLRRSVEALAVGDGMDAGTAVGPLINAAAVDKVERLVADALGRGAALATGGARHDCGGHFYRPTVLTGVTAAMAIAQQEVFGPVAPVLSFATEQDAVRIANDTRYGLVAYFYARDLNRVWRVAEALESGMVVLNSASFSSEATPFGGIKQSGFGREGSKYGLDDYVEIKFVCLGGMEPWPRPDQPPGA
jgi:succinate-semialdehyde dehydrogenase/glutarate-semialdehyde dehydrogenase